MMCENKFQLRFLLMFNIIITSKQTVYITPRVYTLGSTNAYTSMLIISCILAGEVPGTYGSQFVCLSVCVRHSTCIQLQFLKVCSKLVTDCAMQAQHNNIPKLDFDLIDSANVSA